MRRRSSGLAPKGATMGVDAELIEQHPHLPHVIAAAEAQQAWSQQVHPGPPALLLPALGVGFGEPRRWQLRLEQGANQLVEVSAAPQFSFLE